MMRWLAALDAQGRHTDGAGGLYRFATEQSDQPVALELSLSAAGQTAAPPLVLRAEPVACRIDGTDVTGAGIRYRLVVDPPVDPHLDDEVIINLDGPAGAPRCRIELRRSGCILSIGLLGAELAPATRAALLWHAHGRYRELVGLKRFNTGRSGKEVLVFRPRLRAPATANHPALEHTGPLPLLDKAWGAWLLVKTGHRPDVEKEWVRFQTFLADRLHPFVARSDAYLPVDAPVHPTRDAQPQATLISTFLGGDLLRTEMLQDVILSSDDLGRCRALLDRTAAVLAPWHTAARDAEQPLAAWERVLGPAGTGRPLFKHYDFTQDADRHRYSSGVSWDVAFIQKEHLHHHLLGKNQQPGLLPRLGPIRARFGLTHGDLNTRNLLCQGDNVWLIDFEQTGVAPVLTDFARLEATVRLWCLTLAPGGENIAAAAERLERHLLDHFQGSSGGLEPLTNLAADLGADPVNLHRVASCIVHIRALAATFCIPDYGDRRDYLAVLYLTVLGLLRYAGGDAAPPANFRMLVSLAWVLEETLGRLLGVPPYNRGQSPLHAYELLSRDWLAAPEAPARLHYLMERADGKRALAPLAATRGVWQNRVHHLDVYDHITLVLAYLEAILANPVAALLDPAALDRQVAADLRSQDILLPPIPPSSANPPAPARPEVRALEKPVAEFLAGVLGPEAQLLLKWLAVLHDVGKPGTRGLRNGRVQFIGHELYGAQMLRGHLAHLYPDNDRPLRQRLEQLIHQHHVPHQMVSRFTDHPADFDALTQGLAAGRIPARLGAALEKYLDPQRDEFLPDFAGLMLHGYADRMASRGQPIGPTAEILLAVLGFCALHGKGRHDRQGHKELFGRLSKLYQGLNSAAEHWDQVWGAVMGELAPWHQNECAQRRGSAQPDPSWEEVCVQADAILHRRFPQLNGNGQRLGEKSLKAP